MEINDGDLLISKKGEVRKIYEAPVFYRNFFFQYDTKRGVLKFKPINVDEFFAVNIKQVPGDFLFNFKHGMTSIKTTKTKSTKFNDVLDSSNYKEYIYSEVNMSKVFQLYNINLKTWESILDNAELIVDCFKLVTKGFDFDYYKITQILHKKFREDDSFALNIIKHDLKDYLMPFSGDLEALLSAEKKKDESKVIKIRIENMSTNMSRDSSILLFLINYLSNKKKYA